MAKLKNRINLGKFEKNIVEDIYKKDYHHTIIRFDNGFGLSIVNASKEKGWIATVIFFPDRFDSDVWQADADTFGGLNRKDILTLAKRIKKLPSYY